MQKPMTYEMAFNALNKIKNQIFEDGGFVFRIFITPANDNDFMQYTSYVISAMSNLENEDAIRFSSNGLFLLRQIHIEDTVVIHEIIELNR